MKIMVVEDSQAVRERLVGMAESMVSRDSVIAASSVSEANRQVDLHKPEIIVLDLKLPDGNGFEVLMMARSLQPETSVLIMTNDPSEQYRARALKLGARGFFDKSRDFSKLRSVIQSLIGNEYMGQ